MEEQTVPEGDAQPFPKKGEKDPSSKTTDRVSFQKRSLTESGISQHSHWVQENGQFMWDWAGKFSEGDNFSSFYKRHQVCVGDSALSSLIDDGNFYLSPLTGNRWFCFLIFLQWFYISVLFLIFSDSKLSSQSLGFALIPSTLGCLWFLGPWLHFSRMLAVPRPSPQPHNPRLADLSLSRFSTNELLYSNFPLLTRLHTAGWAKAARWACRTHAHLEQQLGSLGHLKSHCRPLGVLSAYLHISTGVITQLSKCPLCCRAFQMALGVKLWPQSQAWRRGLICPSGPHTPVQSEWLTCVYADMSTSPGCLG